MKIITEILLIILVTIILLIIFFYSAEVIKSLSPKKYLSGTACIKDNCFQVELAKTNSQRDRGLMYRKELDKNKGMLFIFDKEGIYPFWMKNTLIPLDIIWIDGNNKIVFISQNAQPCKSLICPEINPLVKAKYVLEINAGIINEIGLKTGDKVELSY